MERPKSAENKNKNQPNNNNNTTRKKSVKKPSNTDAHSGYTYSNITKDENVQSRPKNSSQNDLKISPENLLEKILSNPISVDLPVTVPKLVRLSSAPVANQQNVDPTCNSKPKSPKKPQIQHSKEFLNHHHQQHHHQVYNAPHSVHFQQESFSLNHIQQDIKKHQHHVQNPQQHRPKNTNYRMKNSQSMNAVSNNQLPQIMFDQYWDQNLIDDGLASKTLIQGKIRINQRSYEDAFITDPVR
jgi:hypothetical protein